MPKRFQWDVKPADQNPSTLKININHQWHEFRLEKEVQPNMTLAYLLREKLGYTGLKIACDEGACGACTVIMDGKTVNSCHVYAFQAAGRSVETIESMGTFEKPHRLQTALSDEGAVQCGFCTPGLIASVHDLLDRVPNPDEIEIREALSGNICRCTGYGRIVSAVQLAARTRTAVIDEEIAALEDELGDTGSDEL